MIPRDCLCPVCGRPTSDWAVTDTTRADGGLCCLFCFRAAAAAIDRLEIPKPPVVRKSGAKTSK